MPNQTVYICKPDAAEEANETSIYAMIKEEKAKLGPYKGYIIRRRKKFGEEALEDIFVRPEDFAKYYVPASIMDMALLHDDAFLEVDLAAVESLMPGFANDEAARVRLSFVWASENIAANTPGIYENTVPVFEALLYDADDRVRMEAPEMFRVLGKHRPEFVRPYVSQLQRISETDTNRVVRIHCQGALKAAGLSQAIPGLKE